MGAMVHRLFVRKKRELDNASPQLLKELKNSLALASLEDLTIYHRYDISGIPEEVFPIARDSIFSEKNLDEVFEESAPESGISFAVEYLPGQYDQRADSAAQCVQLLTHGQVPQIKVALHYQLQGDLAQEALDSIKRFCINPVDSREACSEKPLTLEEEYPQAPAVPLLNGFTALDESGLQALHSKMGLAMGLDDLAFCRNHFAKIGRNPSETEIRVLDTYWSDHCRHTTFMTVLDEIKFEAGLADTVIRPVYEEYLKTRKEIYGERDKPVTLMDLATIGMKALREDGLLDDLDVSEEINACSIRVPVTVNGQEEPWLLMFKNETHNHPTEIEPFGGAATCLGGAIRDPLSGRSWVYQAMRVSGSGDPTQPYSATRKGKLPQKKITREAAAGYSSYGNQIGLATGQVAEVYHPGFVAKRMEVGAVIAAAPAENVIREEPEPGDVVILVGGRTGRDGCGGATGSSKAHDTSSILTCGAEVQKGNPVTERKIQRLFRNPDVSRLIRRCNDFGAGGVSVAIGELADSLDIDLDAVPLKYSGLDGTELSISESQERMAVVVREADSAFFVAAAAEENLEATPVARITESGRLRMFWRGKAVVDLERAFLDTNGVSRSTEIFVSSPKTLEIPAPPSIEAALADLNGCSQQGLGERFDSTIGAGSVLHPFGGATQRTPVDGMVALLPVRGGDTDTASVMAYGFQPEIAVISPFHGGYVAVLESLAKAVALGADHATLRLSLQEYFERLGNDPARWGKPFAALLGAFRAQRDFSVAAIGGKDSMSGSFEELDVPPTLISFAVGTIEADKTISPEFKKAGNRVIQLRAIAGSDGLPDPRALILVWKQLQEANAAGQILAAKAVVWGGVGRAVAEQCFGNRIGLRFDAGINNNELTKMEPGSIIAELADTADPEKLFPGSNWRDLGETTAEPHLIGDGLSLPLAEAQALWEQPLSRVFPLLGPEIDGALPRIENKPTTGRKSGVALARPRVFIPVFPGTNCEYDSARVFESAGAKAQTAIFCNRTALEVDASVAHFAAEIDKSQILMLSGGFSAGDEPDGSGKFITAVFRNELLRDAVTRLIEEREGLVLGICNGFQALIKLGLLPYGKILPPSAEAPTLTFNTIGRHISRMVRTRVASTISPWLAGCRVGDLHTIPVSHGEGRFLASPEVLASLAHSGQIATQYCDPEGRPALDPSSNPNGSLGAVEGITSPDGRVFGKMGHSERVGSHIGRNIPGEKDQALFRSGVAYFR